MVAFQSCSFFLAHPVVTFPFNTSQSLERQPSSDNMAVTGIQFLCETGDWTRAVASHHGDWGKWVQCKSPSYAAKIFLKSHQGEQYADQLGMTTVR